MTVTPPRHSASAFREWPLVVFTTLAIMGAGLVAAPLVSWLAADGAAPVGGAVRWGVLLLGAGLAVSTAHLGRPLRAPLAGRGFGRSRLSAEVGLAGLALGLGILALVWPVPPAMLYVAAGAAATAFLVSLGLVYSLPGQQTWRGAVAWMPLSGGLLFSTVTVAALPGGSGTAPGVAAAVVLACDTALLILRWLSLERPQESLTPSHPRIFARRRPILAARALLVDILPGACLLAGLPEVGASLIALGILADRVGFYLFASQHTTEAEVQRVEQVIGSRS